jgi:hypothetical protein
LPQILLSHLAQCACVCGCSGADMRWASVEAPCAGWGQNT